MIIINITYTSGDNNFLFILFIKNKNKECISFTYGSDKQLNNTTHSKVCNMEGKEKKQNL